jgi:uncharacterized protein YegL
MKINFSAKRLNFLLILTSVGLIFSCSDTDFAASQHYPDKPENTYLNPPKEYQDTNQDNYVPVDDRSEQRINELTDQRRSFNLACKDEQDRVATSRLNAPVGTSVTVSGEICPRAFGRINVLFSVDFSGSMDENDPRGLLLGCGRLSAAKAIVKRLEKDGSKGDDIRIGVISFDNGAQVVEPLQSLRDFKSNLSTFKFCGSNNGYTNYRAAFELSQQVLQNAEGNKLLYFISDGLPTIGGNGDADNLDRNGNHGQAGRVAMQNLRAAIPDLTVNSVFLSPDQNSQGAFNYLAELSGGAERLRVARRAADLAKKVVELGIPEVQLQMNQARAYVESQSGERRTVALQSFQKDLNRKSVWLFQTSPFVPLGTNDRFVENRFVVEAPGQDGKFYRSQLILK